MNKILLTIVAVTAVCLTACAQKSEKQNVPTSKALVVYFSATGTTASAAKKLAQMTGGDLYEIIPEQPYTNADLDWNNKQSRSSVEMKNLSSRPAMKGKKKNIVDYDVIYIGYPIWWNLAPTIVNTFIEAHGLKGKTVVPFATSGGSSITNSVRELRKAYPGINWKDGKLLNRADEKSIREWVGK